MRRKIKKFIYEDAEGNMFSGSVLHKHLSTRTRGFNDRNEEPNQRSEVI